MSYTRISTVLIFNLIMILQIFSSVKPVSAQNKIEFKAGINVMLSPKHYENLEELDWKTDALLARLTKMHVNAVTINWLIHSAGIQSNEVTSGKQTPDKDAISLLVKKFTTAGFYVGLRPVIDESIIMKQGKHQWRGTIEPRNVSEWFNSYGRLISDYAILANETGADLLVIGVELNSMEKYTEHWTSLIESVRVEFDGMLTYSSNHTVSKSMPWHLLDFIGIDAFNKLDVLTNASTEDLVAAWKSSVNEIMHSATLNQLPILITEIGTTSQFASFQRSWVWDHHTPIDESAQRRFYEAACEVWKPKSAGIYWWKIHANIWMIADPATDSSFSPLGKEAENTIRSCFN